MSANDKFNREFEAFLSEDDSKLAALYRKLPQTEPDEKLDAAVLAMAHRALNPELVATPRSHYRGSRARWIPAFGVAAGIVFAAGIAYRLGQQNPNDRPDVGSQASTNDVISVRPVDAPASPPLLSPPPPQTSAPTMAARELAPKLEAERAAASAPPAAKSTLERQKSASTQAFAGAPATSGGFADSSANTAQAQAFPAPAQPRKRSTEMDAVERKQAIAAGAWQNLHERDAPADAARAAQPTSAPEASQNGAVAAAPAPPVAMAAPSAAAATKPAELDKKAMSQEKDDQSELPADKWLAHIHELLRAKQHDEALKSLAEFRKRYPQYRLPSDLRDLH